MKAMIFAAGLGTRLRPLTDTMPKALVPVGGRPLLAHVIDKIKASGIDDITVNVHHFAEQIISYLSENYGIADDASRGIHVSDERDLLRETGGGVLHARKYLDGDEPFLIHNVDILSDLDLRALYSACIADSLATLVVSRRESSRYLLFGAENESSAAGGATPGAEVVCGSLSLKGWTNVKTGEVKTPFKDSDLSDCAKLAFSGIHVMSPSVFPLMEGRGERFSIIDFYLDMAAGHRIGAFVPSSLQLLDVGRLDCLAAADKFAAGLEF